MGYKRNTHEAAQTLDLNHIHPLRKMTLPPTPSPRDSLNPASQKAAEGKPGNPGISEFQTGFHLSRNYLPLLLFFYLSCTYRSEAFSWKSVLSAALISKSQVETCPAEVLLDSLSHSSLTHKQLVTHAAFFPTCQTLFFLPMQFKRYIFKLFTETINYFLLTESASLSRESSHLQFTPLSSFVASLTSDIIVDWRIGHSALFLVDSLPSSSAAEFMHLSTLCPLNFQSLRSPKSFIPSFPLHPQWYLSFLCFLFDLYLSSIPIFQRGHMFE